jgi:sugar transferase (PEP-CTERM system associated)
MLSVMNRYVPGRVFVLIVAENTAITASIVAAATLMVPRVHAEEAGINLFLKGWLISAICQLTFYYFSLYDLRRIESKQALLGRLLSAVGFSCLMLAALLAIFPPVRLGKGVLELTFVCMVLVILAGRLSMEWVNRWITAGEKILMVGVGDLSLSLAREIRLRSDLPIRLLGAVSEPECSQFVPNVNPLGSLEDLEKIVRTSRPDRIVIALRERRKRLPVELLLRYRAEGVRIEEAATLFEKLTGRVPVESIFPSTLIFSNGFARKPPIRSAITRLFGILGATLGLIVCAPVMALTALLIRIESPGPIFYRQERVGKDGKSFEILKFRSMRSDAERTGAQWAVVNDPRITKVGAIIRKLRIDELPQFLNILKGEMSFVGPRPERPFFVQLLTEKIPYYDLRHSVRPGVTGWAQVSYPYGATIEDSKNKLEYDLFYVKNNSIAFDLAILFETVKTVVLGKGR